jgi:hypothetical protein
MKISSLFGHAKNKKDQPESTPAIETHELVAENSVENAMPTPVNPPPVSDMPTESIENIQENQSADSELVADKNPRFAVGIDLGTTHCVLAAFDLTQTDDQPQPPQVLAIPQLTQPGSVETPLQLPSFVYMAHPAEIADSDKALPWTAQPTHLVGEIARNLGSKTPIRLVGSAKSWLCHAGVDCKQPILPADAPEDIARISPFQASVAYLEHLSQAWQHHYPHHPLSLQEVTITVPASFDPAARELTVEAAHAVGLERAILLEEPQAALYSWIEQSAGDWRNQVKVGEVILVVDIGGGTTDLSLIAVTQQDGNLELTRVAVGDHILLGGDNMDLALAYTLKTKLEREGKRLQPWQTQALSHSCREAKEKLFLNPDIEQIPIVVANRGSSLVGGSLRSELTRDELNRVLVDGFVPEVAVSDKPFTRSRAGLRVAGLPYAQDAAITRHLAAFLTKQRAATQDLSDIQVPDHASFLHPTAVLFNGGVLKAGIFIERLMAILNGWLSHEQAPAARLLTGVDFDLAVARGASYYGFVRQGKGIRIKGGTAASYYVGIESAMPAIPGFAAEIQALCLAPFGMEEGTEVELPADELGLVIGEPVKFRFFSAKSRRDDVAGTRLEMWADDELQELNELEVCLAEDGHKAGEVVPVHLRAAVTEIGTLELHAVSQRNEAQWKIEFDVRAAKD